MRVEKAKRPCLDGLMVANPQRTLAHGDARIELRVVARVMPYLIANHSAGSFKQIGLTTVLWAASWPKQWLSALEK